VFVCVCVCVQERQAGSVDQCDERPEGEGRKQRHYLSNHAMIRLSRER
jgi:hypothetical protein